MIFSLWKFKLEFKKLEKFDALYNYALADKKFKNFHKKKMMKSLSKS